MQWQKAASGFGFGALLGLLLGLSVSQTVAAFLTAAIAIASAVLGVAPIPNEDKLRVNYIQLCMFAFSCTAFVVLGIYARTHNLFGPSTESQIESASKWVKFGLSAELAAKIVTGVATPAPAASGAAGSRMQNESDPQRSAILSTLSNGLSPSVCESLNPANIEGLDNRLRTLEANGLQHIAERIRSQPVNDRDGDYAAIWRLSCK